MIFNSQVEILKEFPDEITMVFFYNLCAAIIAAIVGLLAEKNTSAWKIRLDISLISIVCTVRYPWKILLHFHLKNNILKLMQFFDDVLCIVREYLISS